MTQVAPLFGPESERTWAGEDWNPVILFPQPIKGTQGVIFTIQRGPQTSVWVNTLQDQLALKEHQRNDPMTFGQIQFSRVDAYRQR